MLGMTAKEINELDFSLITPSTLLKNRFIMIMNKYYNIIDFELLYYSKNLLLAKLSTYNPISKASDCQLLYTQKLHMTVEFYVESEEYLKLLHNNLENIFPSFGDTNEFNKEIRFVLKEFINKKFNKDKFSLFENIDNLINKFKV
jgi:hypothetical protein